MIRITNFIRWLFSSNPPSIQIPDDFLLRLMDGLGDEVVVSGRGSNPRLYRVARNDQVVTMTWWSPDCIYVYGDVSPIYEFYKRSGPIDEHTAVQAVKSRLGID